MRTPLSFFAAGVPVSQPRARACRFGKHARVFNPGDADDWKMIVRNEARRAMDAAGNPAPWEGPLCVDLTFYFPRPKGHFRANGELKPSAPRWHTSKPDRDNCDKAVLDALTNLGVWHDDKQACDGRIRKQYANTNQRPGCEVKIQEAWE